MTITEYTAAAQRTSNTSDALDKIKNGLMGLCGETGEAMDIFKKFCFQGHPLGKDELEHMMMECSDVAWYLHETMCGISKRYKQLTDVAVTPDDMYAMNIEKLKKRYPDKFDSERSMHRAEGDI